MSSSVTWRSPSNPSVSDSAVKIRPKEGDMYFDVVAVVDPVTREAQKLAPLLLVCLCIVDIHLMGSLLICHSQLDTCRF